MGKRLAVMTMGAVIAVGAPLAVATSAAASVYPAPPGPPTSVSGVTINRAPATAPATVSTSALPFTGLDVVELGGIAAACIVAGVALRHRSRASTAPIASE